MDTQVLTESLRELIPAKLEWKFSLYTTHKSRDGLELEFRLCKMQGIPSWIETLAVSLLEKTIPKRIVKPYSPFLPKECIGALSQTDELISEQLGGVLLNIRNGMEYAPDDFISGAIQKPAGYGFYGYNYDENGAIADQILFLRRSNPFVTGKNVRLCTMLDDEVTESGKPILKFTQGTDFVLLNGICYFFSAGIEKDFGLENRHIAICANRLDLIAKATIVNNYEQLEKTAMSAKNARKFLDFDHKILEYIAKLPILERIDFLSTYGITIDNEGLMDTYDPEQCELIIDLLCCRSCLDPLGRLSTGTNITPR